MYKLLVAEGDAIEREALSGFIDWQSIGVEVAGSAESADEAMDMALNNHIDILLTDVLLPGMPGVELARAMLKRQPRLKVLISGSYEQIESALNEMDPSCCFVVAKPVDLGEVKAVTARVARELGAELEQARSSDGLRQLVQGNAERIRTHFFERLVLGTLTDAEMIKNLEHYGMAAVQGRFAVLLFELDGFDRLAMGLDWEGLMMALEAVRGAVLGLGLEGLLDCYYIDRGRFAVLLRLPSGDRKNEMKFILAAAERIRGAAAAACAGSATVGAGRAVGRIRDLRHSFRSAASALAMKSAMGRGQVISHADAAPADAGAAQVEMEQIEESLALAVETGNTTDARASVDKLFNAAKRRAWSDRRLIAACVRLLSRVQLQLHELGEDDEQAFGGPDVWSVLTASVSVPELRTLMNRCVSGAANQILERLDAADRDAASRVLEYVRRHLDSRITAAGLADEFACSPGYINMVLRKETGKTLAEHVVDLRLERASQLLENPSNRIGEIAIRVGYPDVSYFCSLFKKKFGVNPGEYRERA